MARLANSLVTLRTQIDTAFPKRNTASDGWLGDAAHQARLSQHNPNAAGVVCAIDITHDPAHGVDCHRLMEELDASNDDRIFYLIWNRQIDNSNDARTPYDGPNPHTRHLHISVLWDRPERYDNPRPWNLPMLGHSAPEWYRGPLGSRVLKAGARGEDVVGLQHIFVTRYPLYAKHLVVDGEFGAQTEAVVREFQKRSKLAVDGIVGRKTFRALGV